MPCKNNKCPDEILVKTKSKKSHKKHSSSSSSSKSLVNCCIKDCNPDCCTAPFQRLDKLRNYWLINSTGRTPYVAGSVFYRDGTPVSVPLTPASAYTNPAGNNGAFATPITGNNEVAAYYFTNAVRYLNFEECGKPDQVVGWSVNLQSGDLVMYQNLPELNITTGTSRANLLSYTWENLTVSGREQLKNLEPFWRLSLKAAKRVGENPREEGNICEIQDKCGNRYLVAVNRAANPTGPSSSIANYNATYSIVSVRLC